eukprot:COSAG06_NODE_8723_length_2087_cov_3.016097_1_plen_185_part_00
MPNDSAQPVDMDTFPEAANVIERLNRDHTAELDEQLKLFADSRQKPTTFQHLVDTVEFLIQRLKDTYCKMIRAATTLQSQLPTEREQWNDVTRRHEWVKSRDGDKLSKDEVKQAEACFGEYKDVVDTERMCKLKSSIQATLNKALKTKDIPHRVVNHMLLVLKHDLSEFYMRGVGQVVRRWLVH